MLSVHPSLRACLAYSFRNLGWILGGIALVGIAIRWLRGTPAGTWMLILQSIVLYVALSTLVALVLYAAFRACTWSVGHAGMKGRDVRGRRVRIAFDDVGQTAFIAPNGIPILVVASASASHEIHAYLLGVDRVPIHAALVDLAGPDHVLTRRFAPEAAAR